MASQQQDRSELDAKARQGETVVPGGTGGKSLEAQEHLAEGDHSSVTQVLCFLNICFLDIYEYMSLK